jgi:hypothetical protein
MSNPGANTRRVRVERNIYRRPSGVYEVGFKDAAGKQRWRTVSVKQIWVKQPYLQLRNALGGTLAAARSPLSGAS